MTANKKILSICGKAVLRVRGSAASKHVSPAGGRQGGLELSNM